MTKTKEGYEHIAVFASTKSRFLQHKLFQQSRRTQDKFINDLLDVADMLLVYGEGDGDIIAIVRELARKK